MNYLLLLALSFVQNMAFTWVSRSRNSGDPNKHIIASIFSNSIWFVCNYFLIFPEVMETIKDGNLSDRLLVMLVYVSGTVCGSVTMMKINLGHWYIPFLTEEGKSKVGHHESTEINKKPN